MSASKDLLRDEGYQQFFVRGSEFNVKFFFLTFCWMVLNMDDILFNKFRHKWSF